MVKFFLKNKSCYNPAMRLNGLDIGSSGKSCILITMKHLNSILRLPFFTEYYAPSYRSGRLSVSVIQ
ncbi:hypothetical protein [Chryseobacterium sp. CH21]|uniref:hypothetical protein n=1 Tax=Chryseobacterium sp. CH21 TaxID=713556 RepID=UPI00100A6C7A|nr:hypothetical protein [Chryseobacterium sp. CH21]